MELLEKLLDYISGDPVRVASGGAFLLVVCLVLLVLKVTKPKGPESGEPSGEVYTRVWYDRAETSFRRTHEHASLLMVLRADIDKLGEQVREARDDFERYRETHHTETREGFERLSRVEQQYADIRDGVSRIESKLDRMLETSQYNQREHPRRSV